jgi:uncharacterized membrane protein
MSTMVVVAYEGEGTAQQARTKLIELQKQELITLSDAVVVVRGVDGKAKIHQAVNLPRANALSGAFWGALIGMIFLMPLFGAAIGAASGALGGKMMDLGLDDKFIKEAGSAITPGSSALFLLIHQVTPDRVIAEMRQFGGTILQTNLSEEDEARLKESFIDA